MVIVHGRNFLPGREKGWHFRCRNYMMGYLQPVYRKNISRADVKDALRALKGDRKRLSTIASREWIEDNTKVTIPANKRNYRKQEVHLARARAVQDIDYPNHEWAGRPNAEQTVREWQESHPAGKKADCIRETGLSKPTVYKWWK